MFLMNKADYIKIASFNHEKLFNPCGTAIDFRSDSSFSKSDLPKKTNLIIRCCEGGLGKKITI